MIVQHGPTTSLYFCRLMPVRFCRGRCYVSCAHVTSTQIGVSLLFSRHKVPPCGLTYFSTWCYSARNLKKQVIHRGIISSLFLDSIHQFEICGFLFSVIGEISDKYGRRDMIMGGACTNVWWFTRLFRVNFSERKKTVGGSNGNWSCLFLIVFGWLVFSFGLSAWSTTIPRELFCHSPVYIYLSDSKTRHHAKIND